MFGLMKKIWGVTKKIAWNSIVLPNDDFLQEF